MKKRVLWTMGLATAMTAGLAITSLAGWQQSGTDWYYFHDRTGKMLEDEWVQYNGSWYYLEHDGKMAVNSLIDDTYYVDANGARVTNAWQMLYGVDLDEEDSGWRYFSSNGKMYTNGMKEINGAWYYFEDGVMSIGWKEIDDSIYYFRESGARADGWRWLADPDEDSWGEYWYYFSSNGKMAKNDTKKIDDKLYIFDESGRMLTGWVNPEDYTSTGREDLSEEDTSNLLFFDESGNSAEGWHYLAAPDGSDDYWYYFKNGQAYAAKGSGAEGYKTTAVGEYGFAKIGDEYYCFDEYGRLVCGLIEADGKYFFFDEDNGTMKTGHVVISNDEFDDQDFYFATSGSIGKRGAGLTGMRDSRVYDNGIMLRAEEGTKYQVVTIFEDGVEKNFLVNESGKVKTSGTAKDADGVKYEVKKQNGLYIITEVDD